MPHLRVLVARAPLLVAVLAASGHLSPTELVGARLVALLEARRPSLLCFISALSRRFRHMMAVALELFAIAFLLGAFQLFL